jgi:hypothetical protein
MILELIPMSSGIIGAPNLIRCSGILTRKREESEMRRAFAWVLTVVMVGSLCLAAGSAQAKRRKYQGRYMGLLERADRLWEQYKRADEAFFEDGRTNMRRHAERLAEIQGGLSNLYAEWMQTEAPNQGMVVVDLKVGLALNLQMAAIGAELVGLADDDQGYLDFSADLDAEYESVVDDID